MFLIFLEETGLRFSPPPLAFIVTVGCLVTFLNAFCKACTLLCVATEFSVHLSPWSVHDWSEMFLNALNQQVSWPLLKGSVFMWGHVLSAEFCPGFLLDCTEPQGDLEVSY